MGTKLGFLLGFLAAALIFGVITIADLQDWFHTANDKGQDVGGYIGNQTDGPAWTR